MWPNLYLARVVYKINLVSYEPHLCGPLVFSLMPLLAAAPSLPSFGIVSKANGKSKCSEEKLALISAGLLFHFLFLCFLPSLKNKNINKQNI